MIKIKRVYEEPNSSDGFRVLVDRLWPRGLTKEKAQIDLWAKEIAPSNELRKWYHENMDKWEEFKKRYKNELNESKDGIEEFKKIIKKNKTVTFVYSSKEEKYNNAAALKEFI